MIGLYASLWRSSLGWIGVFGGFFCFRSSRTTRSRVSCWGSRSFVERPEVDWRWGHDKSRHLLALTWLSDVVGHDKSRHLLALTWQIDADGHDKSRHLLALTWWLTLMVATGFVTCSVDFTTARWLLLRTLKSTMMVLTQITSMAFENCWRWTSDCLPIVTRKTNQGGR